MRGDAKRARSASTRDKSEDDVVHLGKAFMRLLDTLGRYRIERKRTSLHIARERAFAGFHPKKSYLGVNIVLDRPEASPTASKIEQVSAHRFHHYYKIEDVEELNKSFARLLREAYELADPGRKREEKEGE